MLPIYHELLFLRHVHCLLERNYCYQVIATKLSCPNLKRTLFLFHYYAIVKLLKVRVVKIFGDIATMK